MAHSDSDSDTDCFQSAEDNMDSPSENVNSGSSNENIEVPKKKFYRKRPERAKRFPVKTSSNISIKNQLSALNDSIFKSNPDSIIQDFTSNITKNLNIGFNTIHQTSSNVKDIIFKTLPIPIDDGKESFTYDDINSNTSKVETSKNCSESLPEKECVVQKNSEIFCLSDSNEPSLKSEESGSQASDQYYIEERGFGSEDSGSHTLNDQFIIEGQSLESNDSGVNIVSEQCIIIDSDASGSHVTIEPYIIEEQSIEGRDSGSKIINEHFPVDEHHIQSFESGSQAGSESCTLEENNGSLNSDTYKKELSKEISLSDLKSENSQTSEEFDQSCSNKSENDTESNCSTEKASESNFSNESIDVSEEVEISNSEVNVNHKTEKLNFEDSFFHSSVTTENFPNSNASNKPKKIVKNQISSASSELEGFPDFKVESSLNISFDKNKTVNIYTKKNLSENLEKKRSNSDLKLSELKSALKEMLPKENLKQIDDFMPENKQIKCDDSKDVKSQVSDKSLTVDELCKDGWDDFEFDFEENEFEENQNSKEETWKPLDSKVSAQPKEESNSALIKNESDNSKKEESVKNNENLSVDEADVEECDWGWDSWDDNETKSEIKSSSQEQKEEKSETKSEEPRWSGWDSFGEKKEKSGNWGLGSWGVDALLHKASSATTALTSVLEAGLGAPNPETLAQMDKMERDKRREEPRPKSEETLQQVTAKKSLTDGNLIGGITNLFSEVTTKIVEHSKIQEIGSKVINTGLDTLEIVGKKTMEVLQEQDPGLKNKRALLMGDSKPVLSQVLREVKEKAEKEMKLAEEKEATRKCHFETLFDDYQGLIHLEALEMLSTQCKLQLDQIKSTMSPSDLEEWNSTLEEVADLCCVEDLNDFNTPVINFKISLKSAIEPLKDEISELKIVEIHENIHSWLEKTKEKLPTKAEVHQKAVQTLAQLTAACVQQFHEAGKLMFIKECRKTVSEIDALSRMTEILCSEIKELVNRFVDLSSPKMQSSSSSENIEMREKLEVVSKTSVSYLKQAFELLVPIIQLGTKL